MGGFLIHRVSLKTTCLQENTDDFTSHDVAHGRNDICTQRVSYLIQAIRISDLFLLRMVCPYLFECANVQTSQIC